MRLSKDEFVSALEEVQKAITYVEQLNKFHSKYGADGYIFPPDCVASTLRLLSIIFEDNAGWIETFVFNLNFGNKWKPGDIKSKDGADVKLETIDDLYELLCS